MEPGRLDRAITLLRNEAKRATSGSGEAVPVLVAIAAVRAEVTSIAGRERFAGDQRYAEIDLRFKIRWRADVTPETVVRYDDGRGARLFDLAEVTEVGRREGLELFGTARAE